MNNLDKYFSELNSSKKGKILQLENIYKEVNKKINVISRKDIDNIFLHHILPALAISKVATFKNDLDVLDIGSGGGLPGIPLSILFDKVNFTLVDSRKKKCEVMTKTVEKLKLKNVNVRQIRSNELKEKFDYIIGRAITAPSDFIELAKKNLENVEKKDSIFYISGGELDKNINTIELSRYFRENYFENKYIYVY